MSEDRKVNLDARRVSPRGLITLPSQAQKALGIDEGTATRVSLAVGKGEVKLSATDSPTKDSPRISPGGLLQLSAEAHEALTGRRKGKYSVEFGDGAVVLRAAS